MPGTVALLSLWQNGLEGHLAELHIVDLSKVLVIANGLSCKLPRLEDVQPSISLALIGNHFAKPKYLPAWLSPHEQPPD
eukprot:4951782-Amphidinium_carterae.1